MGEAAQQKARVHFAPTFNEQAGHLLVSKLAQQPSNIDPPLARWRAPNLHFPFERRHPSRGSRFRDHNRCKVGGRVAHYPAVQWRSCM
jgi:hypothetical protein